ERTAAKKPAIRSPRRPCDSRLPRLPLSRSRPHSQIFADGLELSQRRRLASPIGSTNGKTEAMIDVIVDQRFLGVVDGVLDRLELLGECETGPSFFDHADDGFKMACRPPQAADDVGMVLVLHGPFSPRLGMVLSPREDSQGRQPAAECGGPVTTPGRIASS